MTRARNIAGFSTITTTPSPVHVGPIGVLTATRIDGEFNLVDLATRDITAQGIGVTNLQVSGITTGLNVSGIITAQNGINFNGTSTGLNASGVGTIATLNVTGNATIDGNANIGGVLTYEDVTNVDSVGVITARGLNIFGNTTGLNAGISTFTGDVSIADKIIHTGDTNTAIRFLDADTITAETGGTERARINSSGTIFTQSAGDIRSIASGGSLSLSGGGTNLGGKIVLSGGNADANIVFHAQSSTATPAERMRITSGGVVVVGHTAATTSGATNNSNFNIVGNIGSATGEGQLNLWKNAAPSADDVLGQISFCGSSTGDPGAVIKGECDVAWDQGGDASDHAGRLTFFTVPDNSSVAVERMRITSGGTLNLTPADTSSSYATTDGGIDNAITISSTGTSSSQSIGLAFSLNKSGETGAISEIGAIREGSGESGLVFRTRDNSTGRNERVRITSAGVVQIDQGTAGGNHFKIKNDEMSLLAGANGTGDTYEREGFIGCTRNDSGSLPILRLAGQGGIKFAVDANTVRATLTSSGQLLFDTSTAFTSTSYRKIQIGQADGGWINLARTGVPSSGNHLGAIQGFTLSSDGNYHDTAAIDFKADGTQSNSSKGTIIEFYTTPESSTTKTLAASINREGKFRTYDTVNGGDYAITQHGWATKQYFSVPINTSEHRWYKMVNYAAGSMLIGQFVFFSSRNGGFNQTKGFHTWKISYNGYNNNIYGTSGSDSGNLSTGTAAGINITAGGSPQNVYMEIPDSTYGGRVYGYFEGVINNWQFDEGTYTNSAP